MKFKEVQIIKRGGLFSSYKVIASYHDYFDEQEEMINKISSFPPRKGDVIWVKDKNKHVEVCLKVSYCSIEYLENKLIIWCR